MTWEAHLPQGYAVELRRPGRLSSEDVHSSGGVAQKGCFDFSKQL